MRIRELQLRRFGHFTDDGLELIPSDDGSEFPGLHVIYGGNEAGKTTTLYAIRYGLYGIPDLRNDPRTYDFLHAKRDLRIAMVIDSAAGERLAFTQRKRRDDTCFDISDEAPAPALKQKLEELLRGIDRNLFTYKYGIDHESLREGGAGLAGGDNDLGESLFAAATGIVGVRTTLSFLQAQIDELLRSTGRTGKIHGAVKRYNDARVAADTARKAGRSCSPKLKEIERAKALLLAKNSALAAASAERERATHVNAAIGHVVQRTLLLEQIDELGDVIDSWSADLEEQRKRLRSTIATSEAALLTATNELSAQLEKHARHAAAVDDSVLAARDRARHLAERIAEYLGAKGERSKLAAALENAQQGVGTACLAIRQGADPDLASDLIPSQAVLEAARALLGRHSDLDREARTAADALRQGEAALLSFEAELPAAPPAEPEGLEALRAAVKRIETVDTSLLAQLDQRLKVRSQQLDDAAKALPRCSHPAETLLALSAPLEETLNSFDDRLRIARSKVEELETAVAGSMKSLEATDAEIAAKSDGRDLPAVEELDPLRQSRDGLWRRIRTALLGEITAHDTEKIASGTEEAVATAFEEAIGSADAHADRLVRAGEIVGTIAALRQQRADAVRELTSHEADLAAARLEQEDVEAEWHALWAAIEVEPGTVLEMRAWLDELRNVRDIAVAIESDSVEARALRARVERARNDLSAALAAVGRPPASGAISVEILEATATDMLDVADRAREDAAQRDAQRRELEARRENARIAESAAREALEAWRRQWDETAPAIGLDEGSLPEAGSAMLEAIGTLADALRTLTTAYRAHEANNLVVTTFEHDVEALVSTIGGELARDLSGKPPDQVVREVAEAVEACRKAADALEVMAPQIEGLERQKREQQDAITSAAATLDGLAASAGLARVEDLDAAASQWAQREELCAQVDAAERKLVETTKMAPVEVISYLGDTPPDDLPALIATCEAAVEDATVKRDETSETVDALQRDLGELQGAAQAEEHLAEMDDARAEMELLAAQYVPLKLQHDVLTNFLREKASEHMGPAMKRAGAIFSELTCGAYEGVTQDVDEANREVLRLVGSNGKPDMDRSGLSTGTGDQLYLALRLASIYQHLDAAGNEPIPFVVDDILTTFDDERSAATMRVLGELAKHTQVLFFTHHQHLVELARAEISTDVLREHVLG